jgi:ParB family chromosome partitioning protein
LTAEPRRVTGGLGRGLTSLIPGGRDDSPREVPLDRIQRNPYQPRQQFDDTDLEALAASIAEHGVLQPILVTQVPGGYQLLAGERRVRAAQLAGLDRVPAVVRSADEQDRLELALVENLQRSDLNSMDEARAFRQLSDEFGLTQEEIAGRMGRSRPAIANTLRLLDASPSVQVAVAEGRIFEGHARALLGLQTAEAQDEALAAVLERGLSVRQAELLVRQRRDGPRPPADGVPARDAEMERVEAGLRAALSTKVTLTPGRRGGRITIEYYDADDLGRIYERLAGAER